MIYVYVLSLASTTQVRDAGSSPGWVGIHQDTRPAALMDEAEDVIAALQYTAGLRTCSTPKWIFLQGISAQPPLQRLEASELVCPATPTLFPQSLTLAKYNLLFTWIAHRLHISHFEYPTSLALDQAPLSSHGLRVSSCFLPSTATCNKPLRYIKLRPVEF